MKNIAIFASGKGTNFNAIAQAVKRGSLKVNLALLVCDNPQAPVLSKAKEFKIKIALVKRGDFACKEDFEKEIINSLKEEKIDLIVMAGFMRLLGPDFVQAYRNRIINIHPALLPSFKGAHAIKDAFAYGVKITGVTVHFVDEHIDHGAIILQKEVKVKETDTLDSLEARIHRAEHLLYPEAIKVVALGRFRLKGRRVRITGR
ncbi:MAG: phosphoribosylglycinamide formyltransferase [Candidatus Omnitrophica bacterium]|nr:phosphoribosylglycinamide formyltransferase [Candidatus Omnitrophota bacterium]